MLRDLLLPLVMKLNKPEKSAWQTGYRIDWDAPVSAAPHPDGTPHSTTTPSWSAARAAGGKSGASIPGTFEDGSRVCLFRARTAQVGREGEDKGHRLTPSPQSGLPGLLRDRVENRWRTV
ncbi:hypothetical protein [Streptomyces sp. RKAG337]|uniref:hypothetical protein n=1 Tax=Streptomyces sp. RKAG337 TaxID=2893404 RepID=UPI0020337389|nr:hypothetical protein [Streptomyces sp. RKAG337]MCM2430877.1 hypothetical protein [Streptomyces sp. RKAG337]